jgi:hypothetical protein
MPSSTSSSEISTPGISNDDLPRCPRRDARGSWLLLTAIVLFAGVVEVLCRLGVPRISFSERRVAEEYTAVLQAGGCHVRGRQVVVFGNSLLGCGVRFDEARRQLLPDIDARRLRVESTHYFDWYYGTRALLDGGARPEVIVLVLSPAQLVSPRINGDYFAHHLLQIKDLLSVARDLDLSATQTANLAFANLSVFGGLRAEIRKLVICQILPDLPKLTALMIREKRSPLTDEIIYTASVKRLQALRELAANYGARVVIVVPPTGEDKGVPGSFSVQRAGVTSGVPVLVPVAPGTLDSGHYSDNVHLNERGAEIFTARFVDSLRRETGDCGSN